MTHSANSNSIIIEFLRGTVIAAALLIYMTQIARAADPGFGEAKVLAQVPQPGFPEGIVRNGFVTYVTGPATFGTAGNGIPSKIWVYLTANGFSLATIDVVGEDLTQEHANSCAAIDGLGRLYVLNTQLGVLRYGPLQQSWGAPIPNLPPCNQVPAGTDCSPLPVDTPPLPNDLAFDRVIAADGCGRGVLAAGVARIEGRSPGGVAPRLSAICSSEMSEAERLAER